MKRTLKSVVAATIVLGTVVPSVFAANSNTDGAPTDISGNQFAGAISTMINEGVMINYAGNTFKPTSPTSRGQVVAYLYNILSNQGVITQDYSGANPYGDEDNFFQKQINDMYLFGYLDGLDFTDKKGHDVIGEYWTAPVTWLSELLCNVAGVSYDNTKAWDAYKVAVTNHWFDNTGYKDGSMPKTGPSGNGYYIDRDQLAQVLENFYASQYPDAFTGVPTSLTVSAKDATEAQGTADALTVSGTDISGNAVTVDPSKVTFAVTAGDSKTDATQGFVNSNGQFTATAPGTYTVTATYGTALTASTNIVVSGTPASLAVSAPDLVADGSAKSSVTVKVYDVNGNVVSNYNGPVTLSVNNYAGASVENSGQVNAVNGVATFTVDGNASAKGGDSISLTAGIPGMSSVTGTATEKVDAAAGNSFTLGYANGAKRGIEANDASGTTTLSIQALDQAGNKFSGLNEYVTATISGPATFAGGATTQQIWVGGGVGSVVLQGEQGKTGNVVVTVSAAGLTDANFTVPAYVQSPTASISAAVGGSVAEGSTTSLTISALDTNGNTALGENGNVTVSGVPSGVTITGTGVNGSNGTYTVPLSSGYASVTINNTSATSAATLTLQYAVGTTTVSTTVPVTFVQGGASQIVPLNVTNGVYLPANATQAFTFQLEDAAGKAITTAGDTFTVTSNVPGFTTQNVTTDSNGKFSVNVTTPQYPNGVSNYTFTVAESGSTTGVTTYNGNFNVNYGWDLAQAVFANVYDQGVQPASGSVTPVTTFGGLQNATLTSGDSVFLDVYGLNGSNLPVANDNYTVTSSNSSIVSVTGKSDSNGDVIGATGTPAHDGTGANLQLKAGLAGTAVITITDNSVVSKPSVSYTVNVIPQGSIQAISLSGLNTSNGPVTVVPGQSYAITVRLTDAGGNAAYSSDGQSVNVTLGDVLTGTQTSTGYQNFRNAQGATITSVLIPDNTGSAVVYWVAPALKSGTQITLNATGGSLNNGSLGTLQIQ